MRRFNTETKLSEDVDSPVDEDSIAFSWDLFHIKGHCTEMRGICNKKPFAGLYTSKELFCKDALVYGRKTGVTVMWSMQNPIPIDFLAKYPENEMRFPAAGAIPDNGIKFESCLVIDVDPKRLSEVSSTDSELVDSLAVANKIVYFFDCLEMPVYKAMSGNGWHIILPYDPIAVDEKTIERRKLFFTALNEKYKTETVDIDLKVFNLSRVIKLYGTPTRKKIDNVKLDRRHRVSWVNTNTPVYRLPFNPWPELEEALEFDRFREIKTSNAINFNYGNSSYQRNQTLDIPSFLAAAGITYREKKPGLWELKDCPNTPGHKEFEASVTQNTNGAMQFQCFHNSCQWRWREFRESIERTSNIKIKDFYHG